MLFGVGSAELQPAKDLCMHLRWPTCPEPQRTGPQWPLAITHNHSRKYASNGSPCYGSEPVSDLRCLYVVPWKLNGTQKKNQQEIPLNCCFLGFHVNLRVFALAFLRSSPQSAWAQVVVFAPWEECHGRNGADDQSETTFQLLTVSLLFHFKSRSPKVSVTL